MNRPTPRTFLAVPVVIVATVLAATAAAIAATIAPRGRGVDVITFIWARVIAWVSGLRTEARGAGRVPAGRTYVVVSNHQSHLDVVALVLTSPVPLRMLGKKSLFRIPIFGWGMAKAGHIPIDRVKGKTDFAALTRACETLVSLGRSVMVFPEGRRSADGDLLPFKSGAFHIAKHLGAPIVTVGIAGTRNVLPARTLRFRKGRATATWHEPIDPATLGADELSERARSLIEADLADASARDD